MIGGHRFLVSPLTSFEIVRASVSSRCTRLSASRKRRAGGFQLLPRGDMAGFAGLRRGFGLRETLLRGLHRSSQCGEVAQAAGFLRQLLLFGLDIGDVLIEPRQPIAMGAHAGLSS